MQKSYTVKNATFIFDDRVRFKKKIFNYNPETYDELEASKEFTDDIDNCGEKKSMISCILFFGLVLYLVFYKYLLNISILPDFIYLPVMVISIFSAFFFTCVIPEG